MKKVYSTFIIALGILLGGCGSSAPRVDIPEKKLPSWYLNPPHATATYLYGTGEGRDTKDALYNALNDLIASLGVSLSSTYSSDTTVHENGTYTHKDAVYQNKIDAQVQKIRITNFEVMQSQKIGFKRYATLVRVDKKRFFATLKKELDDTFENFYTHQEAIQTHNALEQLFAYRAIVAQSESIQNKLRVMEELDPSFDKTQYLKKIHTIQKEYKALEKKITFSIHATKDAQLLKDVVAKGLSDQHYRIVNKDDRYHFTISVSMKIQYANSYGFTLARSAITLKTHHNRGAVVASNTVTITGQSAQGSAIAKQDVAKRFNQLVKQEGIEKVLGLSVN